MAGTRQRNAFMTLMDNFQQYQEAIEVSANSEGQANEKYEAYLESISYQVEKLKASWEALAQSLGTNPFIKEFYKGLNWVVENLPAILNTLVKITTLFKGNSLAQAGKDLKEWLNFKSLNILNLKRDEKTGKLGIQTGDEQSKAAAKNAKIPETEKRSLSIVNKFKEAVEQFKGIINRLLGKDSASGTADKDIINKAKSASVVSAASEFRGMTQEQIQELLIHPNNATPEQVIILKRLGYLPNDSASNKQSAAMENGVAGYLPGVQTSGYLPGVQISGYLASPLHVIESDDIESNIIQQLQQQILAHPESATPEQIQVLKTLGYLSADYDASIASSSVATVQTIEAAQNADKVAGYLMPGTTRPDEEIATDDIKELKRRAAEASTKASQNPEDKDLAEKAIAANAIFEQSKQAKKPQVTYTAPETPSTSGTPAVNTDEAVAETINKVVEANNKGDTVLLKGGTVMKIPKTVLKTSEAVMKTADAEKKDPGTAPLKKLKTWLFNGNKKDRTAAHKDEAVGVKVENADEVAEKTADANTQAENKSDQQPGRWSKIKDWFRKKQEDTNKEEQKPKTGTQPTQPRQTQTPKQPTPTDEPSKKGSNKWWNGNGKEALSAGIMSGISNGVTSALAGNATTGDTLWAAWNSEGKKDNWLNRTLYKASQVSSLEATGTDRAVDAATSGILSGTGTALMMSGNWIGMIAGGFLTVLDSLGVSTFIKAWINSDKIARQDRIKQANATIDALSEVQQAVEDGAELAGVQLSDYTQEDYAAAHDIAEQFRQGLNDEDTIFTDKYGNEYSLAEYFSENLSEMTNSTIDATQALSELSNGSEKASSIIAAYAGAQKKMLALATYASHEEDINELKEEIYSDQYIQVATYNAALQTGNTAYADELAAQYEEEYDETINVGIQKLTGKRAQLQAYEDDLRDGLLESFLDTSGVSGMNSLEIGSTTLESVIFQIAQEAQANNDYGWSIYDTQGNLTSEWKSEIINLLRQDDKYADLFGSESKYLGQYTNSKVSDRRDELLEAFKEFGYDSYEEILKAAQSGNEKDIANVNKVGQESFNGMTAQQIRDYIVELDPEKINTFARALGMTADELLEDQDVFKGISESDILGTVEDLQTKFESLSAALEELISNGSLSQSTIDSLVSSSPYLFIGVDGSISQDNVLHNIVSWGYTGGGELSGMSEMMARRIAVSAETNESRWDMYKLAYEDQFETWANGDTEKLARLRKASTLSDVDDIIGDNEDAITKWYTMIQGLTSVTDYMNQLKESIVEYESKMYDNEIDNLQSIQDNLDANNDAREKEIALIKAKEKLENAQKEKKRVYRAGVGFVYEADQTAVQEAQEEVEAAETALEQENIQYQIDLLSQQKQLLTDIKNQADWDSIKDAVDEIGTIEDKLSKTSDQSILTQDWASVLKDGFNSEKLKNTFDKQLEETVRECLDELRGQSKTEAIDEYIGLFEEAVALQADYEALLTDDNATPEEKEAARVAYNDKLKEMAASEAVTNEALGIKASDIASAAKSKKVTGSLTASAITSNGDTATQDYDISSAFELGSQISSTATGKVVSTTKSTGDGSYSNTSKAVVTGGGAAYADTVDFDTLKTTENIRYVALPDSTYESLVFNPDIVTDPLTPEEQSHFYKSGYGYMYNNSSKEWESGVNYEYFKSKAKDGDLLYNGWSNRLAIKKGNEIYMAHTYVQDFSDIFSDNVVMKSGNKNGKTYRWSGQAFLDGETVPLEYNGQVVYSTAYSSGSFSTPYNPSPSLVNELGTEAIVTPSGTLTALPSHSGVVPADLTRSLYNLGTIAPNLIKHMVTSANYNTNSNIKSEDNSTNIDTVYATFDTDKDFDVNQFLTNLRSVVNTTQHAH